MTNHLRYTTAYSLSTWTTNLQFTVCAVRVLTRILNSIEKNSSNGDTKQKFKQTIPILYIHTNLEKAQWKLDWKAQRGSSKGELERYVWSSLCPPPSIQPSASVHVSKCVFSGFWQARSHSNMYIHSLTFSTCILSSPQVFDHVFSDTAQCNQLELTAVVAYYGRHYSTFCYHSKRNEWIYFDDAKFRTVSNLRNFEIWTCT